MSSSVSEYFNIDRSDSGGLSADAEASFLQDLINGRPVRKSNSLHKMKPERNYSKVLVIYTGGTIGMIRNEKGAYASKSNMMEMKIKSYPQLHDIVAAEDYATVCPDENCLVLPDTGEACRVVYVVHEYDPLLDSSNMTMDDWIRIAMDIKESYEEFNGFIVLHGTDTMAYTASALSFMLENLGKTVIITGSQIPLYEARSDGRDNLMNSLIIAGNYCIPEVTILFNNKLFRGNRTSKISTSSLDAFSSPNLPPLVKMGIGIHIEWRNVFRPSSIEKFNVHSSLNHNVGLLRLFPSITVEVFMEIHRYFGLNLTFLPESLGRYWHIVIKSRQMPSTKATGVFHMLKSPLIHNFMEIHRYFWVESDLSTRASRGRCTL
ncbi:l-asparaginase [Trichonephila inaurata madagascariensis]|uniref:L-asparaginase n=1 Tax=Trichonephila inaurata madagascariensis TaxID=2747483 RepID=A0A8X6XV70_9ARAC|nr:l-asparaginase [Trichonephila inaurata madagascariensis]